MSNLKKFSPETVLNFLRDVNTELKPTHEKLCYPILERIYKKMCVGIYFSGIKVYEDIIIDGHHRYLASLLAGVSLERNPSNITSATKTTTWNNIDLVEEDWDTEAKINYLNQIDADNSGMTIEALKILLQ
jgi:hypothetical protein